jgi:nitrite reductase/ring-hydroxylating ferredoxin subunit
MAWYYAASSHDLAVKDVVGVEVNGQEVAIYRIGGEYFATTNICTHQFAFMSEGYVENGCIECPLHQGIFDIKTGTVVDGPPDEPLKTFRVKVEGAEIFVELLD